MHSTNRIFAITVFAAAVAVSSGCQQPATETRVAYETAAVRSSGGMAIAGGTSPGGVYTVYQEPPGYPLTISTTATLQTREPNAGGSSNDAGSGESDVGWKHAQIEHGTASVLGESVCEKKSIQCTPANCKIELKMPEDGLCVVSISMTSAGGLGASDCWGYGWIDGEGLSSNEKTRKRDELIARRDEACGE